MLRKLRFAVFILSILAALVQVVGFADVPNVACTAIALAGSLLFTHLLPRIKLVQEYPISTMSVYMFSLTNLTLPLIVSSLELRPITRNLVMPIQDFAYLGILSCILLGAYFFYINSRGLMRARQFMNRRVNVRLGLFRPPSDTQFWILGFIGLACLYYQASNLAAKGSVGQGSVLQKLLVEFVPFAYAPMLIPLKSLYSNRRSGASWQLVAALAGHFSLIVVAAVLRNDRSDFAVAAVVFVFSVIVGIVSMRIQVPRLKARVVVPVLVGIFVVLPLLADLALAMFVVRKLYSKDGARQQIGLTIDMFQRRDEIREYLDYFSNQKTKYDESYYNKSNVFLERFANIKFHDNGLVLGSTLTERQRSDLWEFSIGNAFAQLPAPVLKLMGVSLDKSLFNTMSVGDYFYYLNTGRGLGMFRVGSYIAHGLVLFGFLFFPIFGLTMIAYFVTFDSLTYRLRFRRRVPLPDGQGVMQKIVHSTPFFAPVLLLNVYAVLNPYRFGSMVEIPMFLLRGMPQQIILYSLVIWGTRGFSTWFDAIRGGTKARHRMPTMHGRQALPAPVSYRNR